MPTTRSRSVPSLFFAAVAALVSTATSTSADAQGLALSRFEPSQPGDRFFGVDSPYVAGRSELHAGAIVDYAHNPLVLRTEDGETLGSVVGNQLFLHLAATFALFDRIGINVDMPIALYQSGESAEGVPSPDSAEAGDLRVGLRLRLLGGYHDLFQLGVGAYAWLPTGADASFVSEGNVRGQPVLLLGGRRDRFIWSLAGGPVFRPSQTIVNVPQNDTVRWGAGLGWLLLSERSLQVGAETSGSIVLEDIQRRTANAEILFGGKLRVLGPIEIGAAAGPGLSAGVGTPDVRVVGSLMYTPEVPPPVRDRDGDRIPDAQDACPTVPGVPSPDPRLHGCPPPPPDSDGDGIIDAQDACPRDPGPPNADPSKHGCPPPKDTDGDGIVDPFDACPTEPGVPDQDPKKNGCPPPKDTDKDGVFDPEDACVDIPGIRTADPATNGCPGDRDGDQIRDDKDACPDEKGPADPDPKKNGCPTQVRVTEQEIVILQQVQFDTGKATIKPVSDPLLDQVAQVMKEHPEITKIEVQGHTDTQGAAALNRKLSQDRADSVKKALVKRGVDNNRLTTKGYGPDVPIADNSTPEGRQQNRRVQFKVVDKTPKQPTPPGPAPTQ